MYALALKSWVPGLQVDLTYAVAKFLVEQARGNAHAPASPQEENGLLIYNYQTTFTGKVSSFGGSPKLYALPCISCGARQQLSAAISCTTTVSLPQVLVRTLA